MRFPLMRSPKISFLLMIVAVAVRGRMPGRPCPENIFRFSDLAAKRKDLAASALAGAEMAISDFGLWRTAYVRLSGQELYFVAEPLTGKWHPYPRWIHQALAVLKALIGAAVVENQRRRLEHRKGKPL